MLRLQSSCVERFTQQIYGAVACWCEDFGLKPDETSERLAKTEHEQILKRSETARSKFLGAKLQGTMSQHLETDCENAFRTLRHWRKTSNLQEFVRMRHSSIEFLLECATKLLLMQRLWIWRWNSSMQRVHTPSCALEFQNLCCHSRTNRKWTSSSNSYFFNFLALVEKKIRYHPRQRRVETLGWRFTKGRTDSCISYLTEIQDTIPRIKTYFLNDIMRKKVIFVPQSWSNPPSRKLMRSSPKFIRFQCTFRKKLLLLEKGSGMFFLLADPSMETLFQPTSQNWS